jgi:hypothetical protein
LQRGKATSGKPSVWISDLLPKATPPSEAKEKLENMIAEYVYDALAGEDRDFGPQLLSRRAPLRDWLKYYWYLVLYKLGALHKSEGNRIWRVTQAATGPYRYTCL